MSRFRVCIGAVSKAFVLVLILQAMLLSALLVSCDGTSVPLETNEIGSSNGCSTVSFSLSLGEAVAKVCDESKGEGVALEGYGSRTIAPKPSLMAVASYSVEGSGPGGKSFGPVSSKQNSVSVEDLSSGQWSIVARAYNSNGNELASGKGSCVLKSGSNCVNVVLDTLSGEGCLQLAFKWKSSLSSCSSLRFAIVLEASNGTRYQEFLNANTEECGVTFSKVLAAGSYTLTVKVSDASGLSRGCAEAIRVVASESSIGLVNLEDFPVNLEVSISGTIGIPIPVYATCTPSGTGFRLSARCDSLPAGLSESSLKYRWFCDGEVVGFYKDLEVSSSSDSMHRYDVVVSSSMAGTAGSATVTVN